MVKAVVKQLDEEKIDEILDGILEWCSAVYVEIEKIQGVELKREDLISSDPAIQIVVEFEKEKVA